MEKILNKRKVRGVMKYLENLKEAVVKFKGRMSVEIRM